ncbi:hypothetical protein [Mucilaginibacter pedocola]|uniref:Uncharacterized protein n=1 Tax=Mucilaginibacter pedocola TaxID=1792845 RepID=A0A1S9P6K4_9SPHI|nr:hypothetical protein [Mucilaginibacter pedocola]OOQ56575.1 hypothetical protein BC343_19260 [Mucilaginibacter pedocola]
MTRDQKMYDDSFLYEAFMTRAFRTGRDPKRGFDNGEFRVLEHIENGHLKNGNYQKQMLKLKKLIAKAVGKVLKWKLTAIENADVLRFAAMTERSIDGDDLAVALNGLLDATHRLKEG